MTWSYKQTVFPTENVIPIETWFSDEMLLRPFSNMIWQGLKDMKAEMVREEHDHYGFRYHIFFLDKPFGASVIKIKGSGGYEHNLWEIAVLTKYGHLTYDTDITNDVIPNLDDDDVLSILRLICRLDDAGRLPPIAK